MKRNCFKFPFTEFWRDSFNFLHLWSAAMLKHWTWVRGNPEMLFLRDVSIKKNLGKIKKTNMLWLLLISAWFIISSLLTSVRQISRRTNYYMFYIQIRTGHLIPLNYNQPKHRYDIIKAHKSKHSCANGVTIYTGLNYNSYFIFGRFKFRLGDMVSLSWIYHGFRQFLQQIPGYTLN